MILTTTAAIEGRKITAYLGIVAADAVYGIDIDDEVIGGDRRTLLMVSANGTAVKFA